MGKLDMVVVDKSEKENEGEKAKETINDLEKGKAPLRVAVPPQQHRRPAWLPDCYKVWVLIMISLSLLALAAWPWGFALARPHPALTPRVVVEGVPQYVLDYAPLVYLDTAEAYFPSDIGAQVTNTHPYIDLTVLNNPPNPLNLNNLDALNAVGNGGSDVYLTSIVDITTSPSWLKGVVPDSTGKTNQATSAAIIVTDHGNGLVDAFYMYFYAYNKGDTVLGQELGDHVGDWEHNMVRFQDGAPQTLWYSQHGNGEAFTYNAVEKQGQRPIAYSARGSHANYAITGKHDHTIPDVNLPDGLLVDNTSKGALWDPSLSAYFYNFNPADSSFQSINGSPVQAMNFKGKWGDQQYANSDPRQPSPFFGFYKYVGGPTGPYDKQLNRSKVCPDDGILCIIRDILGP